MINFNDIGDWQLATELDVMEVNADSPVNLSVTDHNGAVLLSGTYIPTDGAVRLYHLHRLLSPLITEVADDFTFSVDGVSKTVHVLQSRVDVSEAADTFLTGFFLTTVMTERDTAMQRKELLTVIPVETPLPDAQALCSYWNGHAVVNDVKTLSTDGMTADVPFELDASPAQFADSALGTLVAYTVTCGRRTMRYRVTQLPTARFALLLRNNFGAWETLYFQGTTEHGPEYTRETALVNGYLTLYNLEETDTRKSYTGPLRPAGVALARDLARSTDVLLLDNNRAGDPVVVTAVDVKHSDQDNAVADLTFTWRRASLRSARLETVRPPRLFDHTFDETYN